MGSLHRLRLLPRGTTPTATALAVVVMLTAAACSGGGPRQGTALRAAGLDAPATTAPPITGTPFAPDDERPAPASTPTTAVSPVTTTMVAPLSPPTTPTTVKAPPARLHAASTIAKNRVVRAAVPTTSTTVVTPTTVVPGIWLQGAVERWLAGQHESSSVAVAVAMSGGSPKSWSVDAHMPGTPAPVRADDSYGVLSITKTFTEALVLREVAAGRIDLDAPMPQLPGVDPVPAGLVITPRMLLQHTSGLVDYASAVGYDPLQPITPAKAVSLSLHSPLLSPPGTKATYAKVNFHWLGLLLEQVTGKTYGALIDGLAHEYGLTHTSLDPTSRPGWVGYASGGVKSTVGDIGRWGAALFTPGRVLSTEQVASLTTIGPLGVGMGTWPLCPCVPNPDGTIRAAAVGQVVAHGGIFYYPDLHMVLVVHIDPASSTSGDQTTAIGVAVRAALPHQ